jgi:hypothetical protein
VTRPQTLPQWLAELRRRGVRCRLVAGRVRVSGVKGLSSAERVSLFASAPMVQQLLEQRAQRRRLKKKQQQPVAMPHEQRERKVVGQIVMPGRPLRLLFEDETKAIDTRRARVLGKIPYGWLIGGSDGN